MKIKIPESIKIGGHTYKVLYQPNLARVEGRQGRIMYPIQEIVLYPDLHSDALSQGFIHELMHGIDRHYLGETLEERVVEVLSEGIFQVLLDMGIQFVKELE